MVAVEVVVAGAGVPVVGVVVELAVVVEVGGVVEVEVVVVVGVGAEVKQRKNNTNQKEIKNDKGIRNFR